LPFPAAFAGFCSLDVASDTLMYRYRRLLEPLARLCGNIYLAFAQGKLMKRKQM
jgi:hypothetical protein